MADRRFDIVRLDGIRWKLTDSGSVGEDFTSSADAAKRALNLADGTLGRVTIFIWHGDRPEKVYDALGPHSASR